MAKTDAERARDYRARKREQRGIVPMMPVADHEAFKAKARALAEQDRAQRSALQADNERLTLALQEAEAGSVPPCKDCGGKLACPACYQSGGYDF